ncbi:MAG TPA: sigma-54 dependent transcriptional regulator [Spirochaetota bacterium]|nr:sigma-54 dependent transcriptional regulator [Spirochaetota bacterium]
MRADKIKILVVDDEEGMCKLLREILKEKGYSVSDYSSPEQALKKLEDDLFDIAIVDMKMPGIDGISFLYKSREINSSMDFIMITAYGSIENAVEAIKIGAFDYITKPFQSDEIILAVDKIIERKDLIEENKRLRKEIERLSERGNVIAQSASMQEIIKFVHKIADSSLSVLITGESGTGKEVIAKYIHDASARNAGPFIPVQCNLLPLNLLESELFGFKKGSFTGADENRAGLFEQAHNGTLFLDEIGDIGPDIQGKLLRFLQDKEVRRIGETKPRKLDVRLISATNKNLESLIAQNKFREDLYFRIKVICIVIPPLRERIDDIPIMTQHFLSQYYKHNSRSIEMDTNCVPYLMKYTWPGNVRELKNCIESASVLCDDNIIRVSDINRILTSQNVIRHQDDGSFKESKARVMEEFEKKYVINMLIQNKGNIAAASRDSKIDRKNFWQMIEKYGINPDDYKEMKY